MVHVGKSVERREMSVESLSFTNTLRFTLYAQHFTLSTLRSPLYALHFTLSALRFTLYAQHFTLSALRFCI